MPINYSDLEPPIGQDTNMGGTKQVIYHAPIRDFLAIQTPIAVPAVPDDIVDIVTPHTFKVGFCFKEMYCTLDKGKFEAMLQGERDGHSWQNKGEIFIPGALSLVLGTASLLKNDQSLVLIPLPDGTMIQIGSADFYAQFKPKYDTGTNSSGVRGMTLGIESMAPHLYIYKSTVSLTPAV